jgi:hypothetical protein
MKRIARASVVIVRMMTLFPLIGATWFTVVMNSLAYSLADALSGL